MFNKQIILSITILALAIPQTSISAAAEQKRILTQADLSELALKLKTTIAEKKDNKRKTLAAAQRGINSSVKGMALVDESTKKNQETISYIAALFQQGTFIDLATTTLLEDTTNVLEAASTQKIEFLRSMAIFSREHLNANGKISELTTLETMPIQDQPAELARILGEEGFNVGDEGLVG